MLNLFFSETYLVCFYCKSNGIKYPLQLIIPNRCRGLSYY